MFLDLVSIAGVKCVYERNSVVAFWSCFSGGKILIILPFCRIPSQPMH